MSWIESGSFSLAKSVCSLQLPHCSFNSKFLNRLRSNPPTGKHSSCIKTSSKCTYRKIKCTLNTDNACVHCNSWTGLWPLSQGNCFCELKTASSGIWSIIFHWQNSSGDGENSEAKYLRKWKWPSTKVYNMLGNWDLGALVWNVPLKVAWGAC